MRHTELYRLTFSFHCLNFGKNIERFYIKIRNKTVSIEENATNKNIINPVTQHSYKVPWVHISLEKNLHFSWEKRRKSHETRNSSHPILFHSEACFEWLTGFKWIRIFFRLDFKLSLYIVEAFAHVYVYFTGEIGTDRQ